MYAIISLLLGCIVAAFVFLLLRSTFKTFGIYHKNKVVTGMHISISLTECKESWRYEKRDCSNHYACCILCWMAKGMGSISSCNGSVEGRDNK